MDKKHFCILLIIAIIIATSVIGCVGPGMIDGLQGYQSATSGCVGPGAIGALRGFESGISKRSQSSTPTLNLSETLKLVGQDGQFLGYINVSPYDSKSFLNEYGIYGSKYSSTSIWNPYSQYGSKYSNLSAFNPYATQPPMIYNGQVFIAYLTMNKYLYPAITPLQLLQVLAR